MAALIIFGLLLYAIEIAIGGAIGNTKGRLGEGIAWAMLLGLIGIIIIACRGPKQATQSNWDRSWGDGGDTFTTSINDSDEIEEGDFIYLTSDLDARPVRIVNKFSYSSGAKRVHIINGPSSGAKPVHRVDTYDEDVEQVINIDDE
jgi:hypothetical protein